LGEGWVTIQLCIKVVTTCLETPDPDQVTVTVLWKEGSIVVVTSQDGYDMLRLWRKVMRGRRRRAAANPSPIKKNIGVARDHLQEVGGVWLLRH